MVQWGKLFASNGKADRGHLRDEMRRRKFSGLLLAWRSPQLNNLCSSPDNGK